MILDFLESKGPSTPTKPKKVAKKASKTSSQGKGLPAPSRSKKTVEEDLRIFQEASKGSAEVYPKSPFSRS